MRVYISGGPGKNQDYGLVKTKAEVKKLIRETGKSVQFVKSGTAEYIIVGDNCCAQPSKTAMKTGGQVIHLSAFIRMLRQKTSVARRRASVSRKRASSKKKTSASRKRKSTIRR